MAEKNIKSRIQHKHDIATNWERATNFIPKEGEIIIYDSDWDINEKPKLKVGNGMHQVNSLPFIASSSSDQVCGMGNITNLLPIDIRARLDNQNSLSMGYIDFYNNNEEYYPVLIITVSNPNNNDDGLETINEIYEITWISSTTHYRTGNIFDNTWSNWHIALTTLTDLGINATEEEINYLTGTKSNIQTQINNLSAEIDAIDWFKKGESIPENSDLDNYKTPGKYYVNSGSISTTLNNCPVENDNFVLYVFSRTSSDTSSLGQMIITLGSSIYLRNTSSNNQWRTWYKMAKYDEMTSYADSVGEQIKEVLLNDTYDTLQDLADSIVDNDDALNKLIYERTIIAGKGLTGGGNLSEDRTLNVGAGTGISVNDDDISLATSGVTAGTYGPSSDISGIHNATMNVPEITVDEYGRVTNIVNRVYTSLDNNQNAFGKISVGSTMITADTAADILALAGSNVTITSDATNDKITIGITKDNVTTALGYTPPTTDTTYEIVSTTKDGLVPKRDGSTTKYLRADGTWAVPPDTDTTYKNATVTVSGLMSASDKEKLDNIALNANKVSVNPLLNSGTEIGTIMLNDEPVHLFAPADTKVTQTEVQEANAEYPIILSKSTTTSEITSSVNKASTLTYNSAKKTLTTDVFKGGLNTNNNDIILSKYSNYSATDFPISGEEGKLYFLEDNSLSLPEGGTAKQVLIKNSDVDGDANWEDLNWNTIAEKGQNITLAYFSEDDTTPPGYRLIATIPNQSWYHARATYAVRSRHNGNGILSISLGCNGEVTNDANLVYCDIVVSGNVTNSTNNIAMQDDAWMCYFDATNEVFNIFWKYKEYDYAYTYLMPLSWSTEHLLFKNTRWMTSISSAYGTKIASSRGTWAQGDVLTGGVSANDYAEYRICNDLYLPGQVVCENGDDTLSLSTERLQPGANIISDTFGFIMGRTENAKCPVATSGRVLAYTYEPRDLFSAGDAVCAAPGGTVSKMTREEIREYPDRIIGTVSAIPNYNTWGNNNININNRIWIKV